MEKEKIECNNNCNDRNNNNNEIKDEKQINEEISECCKNKVSSQCETCGLCKYVPEKISMYGPYTLRGLEPNVTYYYCTCGLTTGQQPLCDQKSCIGTKFTPKPFVLAKKQTLQLLCGCRYSGNIPYCDAIHSNIPFNPQYPPCVCDSKKKEECKKVNDW